jgi:hypothetical protein
MAQERRWSALRRYRVCDIHAKARMTRRRHAPTRPLEPGQKAATSMGRPQMTANAAAVSWPFLAQMPLTQRREEPTWAQATKGLVGGQ